MLDAAIRSQLSSHLDKIVRPVEITVSADSGSASREMMEFLRDVAGLSSSVMIRERAQPSALVPSFSLNSPDCKIDITFAGTPSGHEFTSFVLALLQVGGHPPRVEPALAAQIAELMGDLHFETFYSLSCQNCPDVVQALNVMAVLNPRIRHVAIEGSTFPAEVDRRQIMSVPSVYLNGELFHQGRSDLQQIIGKLDKDASRRASDTISGLGTFDVLVVGGGPAGAASAVYAARKGINVGIVADRFGGQVLDTMAIENFISVPRTEGPSFSSELESHVKEYPVSIIQSQRAEKLRPNSGGYELVLSSGAALAAKTVILATGALWRTLGVPGEEEYRNKGVAFCSHCDGPLFKNRRVAVIGGGNSGVEAAIDLAGLASHVTLIEYDDKLRADDVLQRKLTGLSNVDVIVSAQTTEVKGDGKKVTGLTYVSRVDNEQFELALDGVFIQIGLRANTEWLKDSIDLSPLGEIVVDHHGRTSLPGVFGAGDCTTVPYKQIVVAIGDGAKASLSAFDYLVRETQ